MPLAAKIVRILNGHKERSFSLRSQREGCVANSVAAISIIPSRDLIATGIVDNQERIEQGGHSVGDDRDLDCLADLARHFENIDIALPIDEPAHRLTSGNLAGGSESVVRFALIRTLSGGKHLQSNGSSSARPDQDHQGQRSSGMVRGEAEIDHDFTIANQLLVHASRQGSVLLFLDREHRRLARPLDPNFGRLLHAHSSQTDRAHKPLWHAQGRQGSDPRFRRRLVRGVKR